jgi:hypothetical protein
MRMITHSAHVVGQADAVAVTVRHFSLVCELKEMKGAHIPHVSLTVAPRGGRGDSWSVEADAELSARIADCRDAGEWEPLLDYLADRYGAHPLGELARRAADHLAVCA